MLLRPNRQARCRLIFTMLCAALLAACSTSPKVSGPAPEPGKKTARSGTAGLPSLPPAGSGRGGYYQDDGPGDSPPPGLLDTPDPEPKVEPYANRGNKPYNVFGTTYTPMVDEKPFKQRGIGSWYGKKFHGQKTSSGEIYDMYKMTAAHPTLPIPSYARVTNLANGKQVIVRVNDRGPFHSSRIIDLSYTAALKLDYLGKGSSMLEVERLLPEDIARINASKREQTAQAEQGPSAPEVTAVSLSTPGDVTPLTEKSEAPLLPAAEPVAAQVIAVPALTSSPAPASATAPGFYLQLGAFNKMENALAARVRLMEGSGAALPTIEIVENGSVFRLFSGPFSNRLDAAAAAQRLQQGGGKAMIVQR